MIPSPHTAVQGQPANLRNPGHVIYMIAEKRLILTSYATMHLSRTSRPINAVILTRDCITFLSPLCEQEKAYSTNNSADKLKKDTSMHKWIEILDDHLMKVRGVLKVSLSVSLLRNKIERSDSCWQY